MFPCCVFVVRVCWIPHGKKHTKTLWDPVPVPGTPIRIMQAALLRVLTLCHCCCCYNVHCICLKLWYLQSLCVAILYLLQLFHPSGGLTLAVINGEFNIDKFINHSQGRWTDQFCWKQHYWWHPFHQCWLHRISNSWIHPLYNHFIYISLYMYMRELTLVPIEKYVESYISCALSQNLAIIQIANGAWDRYEPDIEWMWFGISINLSDEDLINSQNSVVLCRGSVGLLSQHWQKT